MNDMQIGILTIATGKYTQFIEPLYESISNRFLTNYGKVFVLFTDQAQVMENRLKGCGYNCHIIPIERKGFPGDTLLRYHHFSNLDAIFEAKGWVKPKHLYYFDADMNVRNNVGMEVLPSTRKPIVATAHPGWYRGKAGPESYGSPEERTASKAFIDRNTYRHSYCAGGFNGGEYSAFMALSNTIKDNIDDDLSKDIVAVWHDESHFNAYISKNLSRVKVLLPSFCYSEGNDIPYPQKIVALHKDHKSVRS